MDNTEIAAQWRIKIERMTGVVVVFEGEVAGWMDGCIAEPGTLGARMRGDR